MRGTERLQRCREALDGYREAERLRARVRMRTVQAKNERERDECMRDLAAMDTTVTTQKAIYENESECCEELLKQLPIWESFILRQFYCCGVSIRCIAKNEGLNERSVSRIKARALARLAALEDAKHE